MLLDQQMDLAIEVYTEKLIRDIRISHPGSQVPSHSWLTARGNMGYSIKIKYRRLLKMLLLIQLAPLSHTPDYNQIHGLVPIRV